MNALLVVNIQPAKSRTRLLQHAQKTAVEIDR